MHLSRNSKIKDIIKHPVGHDLLQLLLKQKGKSAKWAERSIVANRPAVSLDRIGGAGFTDMLLELVSAETDRPVNPGKGRKAWWKEAVVYNVFVPSFMDSDHDGVGDFGGVQQRLPYLESLGIDTIWLWPVQKTLPGGASVDFYRADPDFGGDKNFISLINSARQRGIKIIIGIDIASTSNQHPWFIDAVQNGSHKDYYVFCQGTEDEPPNNWSKMPRGRAWKWNPERQCWVLRIGGKGRVDLDWSSKEVRQEMASVLKFWMDAGVDGFCLGSVNQIAKSDYENGSSAASGLFGLYGFEKYGFSPKTHEYLRMLRNQTDKDGKSLFMGELVGVGTQTAKLYTGEERGELDMVLDSNCLHPCAKGKSGENGELSLADIRDYYMLWMEQFGSERWMPIVLGNAQTPRIVSRIGASPVYRSIVAKLLGLMQLTLRGTPVIYQGEELGLANTRFASVEELRDKFALLQYNEMCENLTEQEAFDKVMCTTADHARIPIPWSAGPLGGFTGAQPWIRVADGIEYLNATVQMQNSGSVWSFYRRLIAFRKQYPALVYGTFNPVFAKNKRAFCYFRIGENEKLYIEINITEKEIPRPGRIVNTHKLLLSNYDTPGRTLRPYEANIYLVEQ